MESFFKLFFFEKENHMAILKNKTQGNYTVVSQNIMRDNNLSLTERGMLLTLLSLSDNWNLTIKGLSQILPDGKEKISKTLNSLIEKGYVTRERSKEDERITIVSVTKEGEVLKEQCKDIPIKLAQNGSPLSSKEAKELYRLLYRILDAE